MNDDHSTCRRDHGTAAGSVVAAKKERVNGAGVCRL
jgi:hypothetical protein